MRLKTFPEKNNSSEPFCPRIETTPRHGQNNDVAVLAMGTFWQPQPDFQNVRGIVDVVVGYSTRTNMPHLSRRSVQHTTEAVLIEFNPQEITYMGVLNKVSAKISVLCVWKENTCRRVV